MHRQRAPVVAKPHGHGFAARTSWNRAGNSTAPRERCRTTRPDSSGCRSASSTPRGELRCLVEEQHAVVGEAGRTGPGDPAAAADDRGGRRGVVRCAQRRPASSAARPPGSTPATEWIAVTSSDSSRASAGSSPGSRSASIVLPAPGGPCRSTWCPPAAATSRANRASAWPATSARSGERPRRRPSRRARTPGCRRSPRAAPRPARRGVSTATTRRARDDAPPPRRSATGTTTDANPALVAASTAGSTPRTGRTRAVQAQLADEDQSARPPRRAPSRPRRGRRRRGPGRTRCRTWAATPATGSA